MLSPKDKKKLVFEYHACDGGFYTLTMPKKLYKKLEQIKEDIDEFINKSKVELGDTRDRIVYISAELTIEDFLKSEPSWFKRIHQRISFYVFIIKMKFKKRLDNV